MTVKFARGSRAYAFCDRCYQRRDLKELSHQIVNQRITGLKVCEECNDADNPQYQLGKFPINDPMALQEPRPDINPGRSLFGWNPVGNSATTMNGNVGSVAVYIG
jgi:hypothetical protein